MHPWYAEESLKTASLEESPHQPTAEQKIRACKDRIVLPTWISERETWSSQRPCDILLDVRQMQFHRETIQRSRQQTLLDSDTEETRLRTTIESDAVVECFLSIGRASVTDSVYQSLNHVCEGLKRS